MASESALPSPPPFLAATLVLRSRAIFASLVQDSVTAFLDSAVEMELWQACKMNSAALLEHIWQGSAPETEPSPASLGPGNGGRWSRRKFLRTDRHYRRFQFRRAIVEAVKQDKAMELAQWLYAHFHGCIVPFGAVQEAAAAGKLELLEFFKQHELPAKMEGGRAGRDEVEAQEGNVVRWGRHDMARAAERKDNMHVVQWLHDNTPRVPRCIRAALFNAVRNGDVKMLRWFCAEYRTRVAAREFDTLGDGEDDLDDMMRREEEEIERLAMGLFIPIRMNAEGATTGTGAAIPAVVTMVGAFSLAMRVGQQARGNPPAAAVAAVVPAQQGAQPAGAGGLFPPNLEQLLQEAVAARVAAGMRGREPEAPMENIMELMQEDREGLMVGENARELLCGSPQDFMREAVLGGHLSMMRWLLKNGYARNAFLAVWVAMNACRLDMVMWLIRNKLLEAGRALEAAARLGCLDMAKRLYTRYWKHIREQRYYPLTESPVRGMLRMQRDPPMWISEKTMAGAVALGDLDLVEWLVESFGAEIDLFGAAVPPGWNPFHRPHLIDTAARHLPVVKYLHQISVRMTARGNYTDASGRAILGTGPTGSTNAMDSAAAYNCLDVVQWLHAHRPEGCTARAMDSAAAQGHLEVMQWLHENRREGCTVLAMDDAASGGHLEVVKWLHTNRSEGCTTRAMDNAAAQGHLEVVKWLHMNRAEGCTTAAMDAAAALGHLDIIKWLHNHQVGGCTTHAMDNAAASGNLAVVKWFHDNRSEGCTIRAMEEAVAAGHLHVVQWLHEHRIEGCTKVAVDLAARFWDFDLVLFLHSQRREGCTTEAFRATRKRDVFMDMYEPDADFPSDNIFDWLSEHYPSVKPRQL